ncbi:TPR repeat protein [Rhizobium aquaticum]|uniref:TPR repeat protein n=2 Tax=Rhizobium aquaticum TaxID=1549636 RepID=A0ABV2J3S4_9HYPH
MTLAAIMGSAAAHTALATDDLPGVNLQDGLADDDAAPADGETAKTSRVTQPTGAPAIAKDAPLDGKVLGPDGKPVDQLSTPGETPSAGTGLYDRMGLRLPDLPAEKPFTGKVDEAYGAFQRGYYITALDKALPRAQLGDPAAQTLIAELLARGMGVKQDIQKALFWYSKAADGGDPSAMFRYALILMEGRLVKQDKARADELMRKAADAGNPLAAFNWAQILVSQKPGEEGLRNALPYYEKSAAKGIADAEYALSQIYLNLPDLPKEKRDSAKDWLQRAAKAGYDTAELDMAIWLIDGIQFPRDQDAGFAWMYRAASAGNVVAQNKLAHMLIQGIGTKQDVAEAGKWYVMSRRAGREDKYLEDAFQGLTEQQQKAAIEAANKQQRLIRLR